MKVELKHETLTLEKQEYIDLEGLRDKVRDISFNAEDGGEVEEVADDLVCALDRFLAVATIPYNAD